MELNTPPVVSKYLDLLEDESKLIKNHGTVYVREDRLVS